MKAEDKLWANCLVCYNRNAPGGGSMLLFRVEQDQKDKLRVNSITGNSIFVKKDHVDLYAPCSSHYPNEMNHCNKCNKFKIGKGEEFLNKIREEEYAKVRSVKASSSSI